MIYKRFRAGETTAKPAWNDSASVRYDGNRRPAYAQRSSSSRDDRVRPSAAAMTRRSRSSWAGAFIGQQECCDIPALPSFALTPGSASVIPPATAADLPNRQRPCLRNSSARTPLRRHKCLLPAQEIQTLAAEWAATTHSFRELPGE